MSMIDYGALLKVDNIFVNKNKDLFMKCSDTGYMCEYAKYDGKDKRIAGNYYVYAGDEDLLLCFYKSWITIIKNGEIVKDIGRIDFEKEVFAYSSMPKITIEHLDKTLYQDTDYGKQTWSDYVREAWYGTTGEESYHELQNGKNHFIRFIRMKKRCRRINSKYKTNRWKASWEHNGHKYEVIYGYGIDPSEKVWKDIRNSAYDFTDVERAQIDSWFNKNEKDK